MFSMPNVKSHGLDGFNSRFFKLAWGEVGPLVCAAMQEFSISGQISMS